MKKAELIEIDRNRVFLFSFFPSCAQEILHIEFEMIEEEQNQQFVDSFAPQDAKEDERADQEQGRQGTAGSIHPFSSGPDPKVMYLTSMWIEILQKKTRKKDQMEESQSIALLAY